MEYTITPCPTGFEVRTVAVGRTLVAFGRTEREAKENLAEAYERAEMLEARAQAANSGA